MKKFICILMIVCCVGGLCSCAISQPNNYTELEERISRLEKLFNKSNESTTKPTETPTITDCIEPFSLNSTEPLTTSNPYCVYDLSEMTPENIVETIKYYIDSRPQNGDTYESVKSRLQVEPLYWREPDKLEYYSHRVTARFVDVNHFERTPDYIDTIGYSGFGLEMNGVTLEKCNTIKFDITFNIEDYSRAEKVFDAIVNYLNSNVNHNIKITKNSGVWDIFYQDNFIKDNSIFISHIEGSMHRETNTYRFYIHITITDTNQE